MIEVYKHVKGPYSVDTLCIKLEDTGSRGHEFKLKKDNAAKAVLPVRLKFFSLGINNTWDRLPSHVMDAPRINCFKTRLDKHLTQYRYSRYSFYDII